MKIEDCDMSEELKLRCKMYTNRRMTYDAIKDRSDGPNNNLYLFFNKNQGKMYKRECIEDAMLTTFLNKLAATRS